MMWIVGLGRGGGGGMGRGGGGRGGGGRMFKTAKRVVSPGVREPSSHSTTTATGTSRRRTYKPTSSDVLSLSYSSLSPPFSPFALPIPPTWPFSSSSSESEGFEWECVDGSEFERGNAFSDDSVFGSVPSLDEVQNAVSSLQQVLDSASPRQFIKDTLSYNSDKDVADEITSPTALMKRVSSVGTELDWIEPSLKLCSPRMLQPYGSNRVCDAFHLLQTEPCIQRMVVSLSSDKAVWDAVLNNEVVRELRESLGEANGVPENPDDSSDGSDAATNILSWLFSNAKAKVMELIENLAKLVSELFQPPKDAKTTGDTDPFQEKLRASVLLSIVVLLIVVVSRLPGA